MSIVARQSTALELAIGPVLDADGVAVTGCVVADFKIKKTTGNFAALNGSATLTHVSAGVYDLVLTTSDVDTVGLATIAIDDTVNACQSVYLQVMEEVVYDALYAASANTFTGAAGSTKLTGLVLADTVTTLTNLPAITASWLTAAGIASDAFTAAKFAADVTTEFQAGLSTLTQTQVTGGAYALNSASFAFNAALDFTTTQKAATLARVTLTDTASTVTNAIVLPTIPTAWITADGIATDAFGALELAAGAGSEIAAAVRTELAVELTRIDAAVSSRSSHTAANVVTAMGTGTFLTAIPWNASWDAEVQSEAEDALAAVGITTTVTGRIDAAITTRMATYTQPTGFLAATFPASVSDATLAALASAHGAGSWATATGFSTLTTTDIDNRLAAYDGPTNTEMVAAFTEIKGATWATTDTLEAIRDRGDAAWITATGFSTLDAAGVRTAVGLASANLDNQLAAIVADTNELQTDWANGGRLDLILDARASQTSVDDVPTNAELTTALGTADDAVLAAIAALNNLSSAQVTAAVPTVSQIWTTALTEAYKTAGSTGTAAQLLYEILQNLTEFANSGTTRTVKKLDGTTAKTYTYDSASAPTSITETA